MRISQGMLFQIPHGFVAKSNALSSIGFIIPFDKNLKGEKLSLLRSSKQMETSQHFCKTIFCRLLVAAFGKMARTL